MFGSRGRRHVSSGVVLPNSPNYQGLGSKRQMANKVRNPLRIDKIDLCISDNGCRHHTDKFNAMKSKDSPQLIVRRGQVFYLKLLLDRNYWPQVDGLSFYLVPADGKNDNLRVDLENSVVVPVLETMTSDDNHLEWYARVLDSEDKFIFIKIHPAPDCPVGEWKLEIDTKLQAEPDGETYPAEKPIIILFNPWCPHDQVYMEDEDKCEEYVLNETGMVFRGSYNNVQSTPWFYGQFERDVLQCAVTLYTQVATSYRNDPVLVCRSLSAALNSTDGKGVLAIKWDGKYEEGHTRPEAWAGSVKILTKYYKTRQPVKYGQCWVFAGVCTTVCRALGIPCRPVTIYNCAYESHYNLFVDQFLEESSKWMPTEDHIWHHRVWNEVWMTRWDLQKPDQLLQNKGAYDGWNIIDCTNKLQRYDIISQCDGPASVKAIKNGDLDLAYDTLSAYAEVNADILYWKDIRVNEQLKFIGRDTSWIGQKVVTKAIGCYRHEDITLNYKHPAGGTEERDIMEKALRFVENQITRFYLNSDFKRIKFEIKLPEEPPFVGSPIEITFIMHNYSVGTYEVEVAMVLDLENYAGTEKVPIKVEQFKVQIKSKEAKHHTLRAVYDDYKNCNLKDEDNFRIGCHAFIQDVDFDFFKQDVLKMKKPKLSFMVDTSHHPTNSTQQAPVSQEYSEEENKLSSKHFEELGKLGIQQSFGPFNINIDQELQIQASFTNPLPVRLANGCFQFEGPDKVQKVSLDRDIPPGGVAVGKCQWKVKTPGRYEICGTFVSNELKEINGMCHIDIT